MPAPSKKLLVLRFSALGDVAMTVPVVRLLLAQHPTLEILFVSNKNFSPLFKGIERLEFLGADFKGRHKGILGIVKLFWDCRKKGSLMAVADLHEVLRSKLLCFLFRTGLIPVQVIDKGRREKKALTRNQDKVLKPLPSTFIRYANVFERLGLTLSISTEGSVQRVASQQKKGWKIGIAPFAQYREKTYPAPLMKQAILQLQQSLGATIFLFGAPGAEASVLTEWEQELPGVVNRAGVQSFADELAEIASLDAMVTMDSANMHLASLYNVPVISIWGATHPYAGFMGWQQGPERAVQSNLSCRPCSVFGNKACYRGDWACMNQISPAVIVSKVQEVLMLQRS